MKHPLEHHNGNPGRIPHPCREKGDFRPMGCIAAGRALYQVPFDIPDQGRILQGHGKFLVFIQEGYQESPPERRDQHTLWDSYRPGIDSMQADLMEKD